MNKTDKKQLLFGEVLLNFEFEVKDGELRAVLKKDMSVAELYIFIKKSLEKIDKEADNETNRP